MSGPRRTSLVLLGLLLLSMLMPQAVLAQTGGRSSAPVVTSDLKNPSYFATGSIVTFSGTATDDVGVVELDITFNNGVSWNNITTSYDNATTKYSYPWDTTGQTGGTHQITIRAKDGDGKAGSALVSLILDDDTPEVVIKQPATATATLGLGDTLTLSGTASDPTTPLSFLNVSTDGGQTWTDITTGLKNKAWTYNWATKASDPPAVHWLIVQGTDMVGHLGQASVNITFTDLKAPLVAITAPTDGKELTTWDSVSVHGTASDNVGVQTLEVAAFQTGATVKRTNITRNLDAGSWVWTWDSKGLMAGKYTVQSWARDRKGNQATAAVNVTLTDKTAPTVSITSPYNKTTYNHGDPVYITGKASDNVKLMTLEVTIDALPAVNITSDVKPTGDYGHTLTGIKDGSHLIKVKATDMSGNTKETQVLITIKARPSGTPVAAIAGGVAVAVILVFLILFIGMKKGWFGSKKEHPVPGTQSVATPPLQQPPALQALPVPQAQPVPPAYPYYAQQPTAPQQPPGPVQAAPAQPYSPATVTEPVVEEDLTPKVVPMPVDVDAEEVPQPPKPVPKPVTPQVEARPPVPGPPKKPGFQRPALAKNPQQAPERCPSCGLDVDYESLKCQECGAKLF